jgi:sulfur carrier protein ThiS
MFRINPDIKKKAVIHKLLDNGYRFCVISNGQIIKYWRYEYEALRQYKRIEIIPLRNLI